jgi:hypothetical protein
VYSGSACDNLVGDPDVIRACIEMRAVRPVSDEARAKIIVARAGRITCDDAGRQLLYPDLETHHAVIARSRRRGRPADPTLRGPANRDAPGPSLLPADRFRIGVHVRNENRDRPRPLLRRKAVCGPDDRRELVITLMMPDGA